uniref:B-cell receptor CD22 n=1 Tax=Scophthalmus maximus TaxID=52904 RepID=A0A8D3BMG3_SCOMX
MRSVPSEDQQWILTARSFWFVKDPNVDLTTDPKYSGRVEYTCEDKCCLRISDLRQSDSAEYKFRFITNQPADSWTGSPGVTLSVKGKSLPLEIKLTCHSSCQLPHHLSYVWYNKHNQVKGGKKYFLLEHVEAADSYYCAIKGHEHIRSASVPVVSSPSGEIMEGSSVTLTCSSDAQPAANYTWYKKNEREEFQLLLEGTRFVFSSIQSSDSGVYHCTAENELGRNSTDIIIASHFIFFTFYFLSFNFMTCSKSNRPIFMSPCVFNCLPDAPKLPSVSVSPNGEIVEGSSVNLTCSSDANPPADYTWYKENEDSPKASEQIFNIADVRAEHGGNYLCAAQNIRGRHNSTVRLTVKAGKYVGGYYLDTTDNLCE